MKKTITLEFTQEQLEEALSNETVRFLAVNQLVAFKTSSQEELVTRAIDNIKGAGRNMNKIVLVKEIRTIAKKENWEGYDSLQGAKRLAEDFQHLWLDE